MIVYRKKYWPHIILGAVSLVAISVFITVRVERGSDEQAAVQNSVLGARFEADESGLMLDYQSDIWREVTLTDEEKDLGYKAIYQAVIDSAPLEMSIRRQADVRRAAQVTNQQPLDVVLSSLRKSSKLQYEDFLETNYSPQTIAGRPAFEFDFDYTRRFDDRSFLLHQKVVAVSQDQDVVWVVTFQTLASNFTQQYEVNFKPIIESMTFE